MPFVYITKYKKINYSFTLNTFEHIEKNLLKI